jgi:hypothetical protein
MNLILQGKGNRPPKARGPITVEFVYDQPDSIRFVAICSGHRIEVRFLRAMRVPRRQKWVFSKEHPRAADIWA